MDCYLALHHRFGALGSLLVQADSAEADGGYASGDAG